MQPSSPNVGFALVASAEKRAVSPVVNPQAVVRVARSVRVVASATAGGRHGATVAGFCNRGVRSVRAASTVPPSSPNPAFEPTAASGVGSIPRWACLV
jgi:hypothetical protein